MNDAAHAFPGAIPRDIPEYGTFLQATPVTEGWSADEKYRVVTEDGDGLMLRLADVSLLRKKKREFEALALASEAGLSVPRPVAFGTCDGGRRAYLLISWIEGHGMADVLAEAADERERYALGIKAGRLLRRLHALPALPALPATVSPDASDGAGCCKPATWPQMFDRQLARYVAGLDGCGVALPGREAFERFVDEHRHLVDARPLGFAHGDFHVGNLVVTPDGEVAAIDFDRCRTADPWYDHKRVVFDVEASAAFASGRIDGYFDGRVPDEFWALLGVYCASNVLGSLAWALPFGESEVAHALRQAEDLLDAYEGMTRTVPAWYDPAPSHRRA